MGAARPHVYADLFDDDLDGAVVALDAARSRSVVVEMWGTALPDSKNPLHPDRLAMRLTDLAEDGVGEEVNVITRNRDSR